MNYLLKTMLLIAFSFLTITLSAQEESILEKRSEIKINALLTISGLPELSYEYLLNESSSVGISAYYNFNDQPSQDWRITPFYRLFFGKKIASGFFIEGFGMIERSNNYDVTLDGFVVNLEFISTEIRGALGISIGTKFITKKNIVAEIFYGVGRLIDQGFVSYIGRGGISVGKRF